MGDESYRTDVRSVKGSSIECQNLAMKASIIKFLIVVAIGFAIILAIVLFGHSSTPVSVVS